MDAKKAKLLEGSVVQVMSSVASKGGQKDGDLFINSLLICIFGMTIVMYNKIKENGENLTKYYRLGSKGRLDIFKSLKNLEKVINKRVIKKK